MLSSAVLADLTTARIALQTRQFELALEQAKDLATAYPFDSAMIAARAHVELGQLHQALRAAKRAQALEPKLVAPRILRAIAWANRAAPCFICGAPWTLAQIAMSGSR